MSAIAVIDVVVPPPTVIEVTVGTKGDPGPPGPPGGSSSVFFYKVDANATAPNDPGAGKLRYNHTTQTLATTLYVDWLTEDGFDAHQFFLRTAATTHVVIQDADLAVTYQEFEVTGPAINHPDWFEVPVRLVTSNGAGRFTHNTRVAAMLIAESDPLPTAPVGQVLVSQGVEVAPVFSPRITLFNETGDTRWELYASGSDFVIDAQSPAGVSYGRKLTISVYNGNLTLSSGISNFEAGDGIHAHFVGIAPDVLAGHNLHRQLGALVNISDSQSNTPGNVVLGGGSFNVLARWNGTAFVVISG